MGGVLDGLVPGLESGNQVVSRAAGIQPWLSTASSWNRGQKRSKVSWMRVLASSSSRKAGQCEGMSRRLEQREAS
ncbi:hypothetical protein [Amycolatopsis pithecellobii]|uniref:Uncharacterized protein n=1 Tax=Amycolatopsis pithecellobii TaxID=664692 RepID=A0A6N7Z1I6_9PSEU|nr:hypothetical protein [Amycolatopsis pithecellobii]MTD55273.1 hypothetical protein [Amycolatopsis pithecellobii]